MTKKLFLLVFTILVSVVWINAQNKKPPPEKLNLIREGVGIEGIAVGKSTMDDVIKKFGKKYRWFENKKYSYQMNYNSLGLAFYMCQSDKR